jgi:hypothetical protein
MRCKIEILIGCQFSECATEVSYPPGMLRMWNDGPICEGCYEEEMTEDMPDWRDLPAIKREDLILP